jgi:hypothetical protein
VHHYIVSSDVRKRSRSALVPVLALPFSRFRPLGPFEATDRDKNRSVCLP